MVTPEGEPAGRSSAMSIVDELRTLDTNDPGRWPLPIRVGAVAIAFVAVVAVGVYLFVIKEEMPLLERAATGRARSANAVRGSAAQSRELRRLPRSARGDRARLRRDAAAAAGQDGGPELARRHLANRPRRRPRGAELFQPTSRSRRTSMRSYPIQAPLHRQLSRARQFCERHRCTAAHCDLT